MIAPQPADDPHDILGDLAPLLREWLTAGTALTLTAGDLAGLDDAAAARLRESVEALWLRLETDLQRRLGRHPGMSPRRSFENNLRLAVAMLRGLGGSKEQVEALERYFHATFVDGMEEITGPPEE